MNIKFFKILNISMIKRTLIIFTLLLFTAFGCKAGDTEEAVTTFSYLCPNGDPFTIGDAPSDGAPGCEACNTGYHVADGGARCDANTYNPMLPDNCLLAPVNMPDVNLEKRCGTCDMRYHLADDGAMCDANTYSSPPNCQAVRDDDMPVMDGAPGCKTCETGYHSSDDRTMCLENMYMPVMNCALLPDVRPSMNLEKRCGTCDMRYHLADDGARCDANTYSSPPNCETVRDDGMPVIDGAPGCKTCNMGYRASADRTMCDANTYRCDNGTPATGRPTDHNEIRCMGTCNTGYVLFKVKFCHSDRDSDGVRDADDSAPDDPNISCEVTSTNLASSTADCDNDGVRNVDDNCPSVANSGAGQDADQNRNDIGDACDDSDGDGVVDADDSAPDDPNISCEVTFANSASSTADCDNDDFRNVDDNCPSVANPVQADNELDGVGDVCDVDDDNDGLIEIHYLEDLDYIRHNRFGTSYKPGANATAMADGAPLTKFGTACADITTVTNLCGYELARSLNFSVGASYRDATATANMDRWTSGRGWDPIMGVPYHF